MAKGTSTTKLNGYLFKWNDNSNLESPYTMRPVGSTKSLISDITRQLTLINNKVPSAPKDLKNKFETSINTIKKSAQSNTLNDETLSDVYNGLKNIYHTSTRGRASLEDFFKKNGKADEILTEVSKNIERITKETTKDLNTLKNDQQFSQDQVSEIINKKHEQEIKNIRDSFNILPPAQEINTPVIGQKNKERKFNIREGKGRILPTVLKTKQITKPNKATDKNKPKKSPTIIQANAAPKTNKPSRIPVLKNPDDIKTSYSQELNGTSGIPISTKRKELYKNLNYEISKKDGQSFFVPLKEDPDDTNSISSRSYSDSGIDVNSIPSRPSSSMSNNSFREDYDPETTKSYKNISSLTSNLSQDKDPTDKETDAKDDTKIVWRNKGQEGNNRSQSVLSNDSGYGEDTLRSTRSSMISENNDNIPKFSEDFIEPYAQTPMTINKDKGPEEQFLRTEIHKNPEQEIEHLPVPPYNGNSGYDFTDDIEFGNSDLTARGTTKNLTNKINYQINTLRDLVSEKAIDKKYLTPISELIHKIPLTDKLLETTSANLKIVEDSYGDKGNPVIKDNVEAILDNTTSNLIEAGQEISNNLIKKGTNNKQNKNDLYNNYLMNFDDNVHTHNMSPNLSSYYRDDIKKSIDNLQKSMPVDHDVQRSIQGLKNTIKYDSLTTNVLETTSKTLKEVEKSFTEHGGIGNTESINNVEVFLDDINNGALKTLSSTIQYKLGPDISSNQKLSKTTNIDQDFQDTTYVKYISDKLSEFHNKQASVGTGNVAQVNQKKPDLSKYKPQNISQFPSKLKRSINTQIKPTLTIPTEPMDSGYLLEAPADRFTLQKDGPVKIVQVDKLLPQGKTKNEIEEINKTIDNIKKQTLNDEDNVIDKNLDKLQKLVNQGLYTDKLLLATKNTLKEVETYYTDNKQVGTKDEASQLLLEQTINTLGKASKALISYTENDVLLNGNPNVNEVMNAKRKIFNDKPFADQMQLDFDIFHNQERSIRDGKVEDLGGYFESRSGIPNDDFQKRQEILENEKARQIEEARKKHVEPYNPAEHKLEQPSRINYSTVTDDQELDTKKVPNASNYRGVVDNEELDPRQVPKPPSYETGEKPDFGTPEKLDYNEATVKRKNIPSDPLSIDKFNWGKSDKLEYENKETIPNNDSFVLPEDDNAIKSSTLKKSPPIDYSKVQEQEPTPSGKIPPKWDKPFNNSDLDDPTNTSLNNKPKKIVPTYKESQERIVGNYEQDNDTISREEMLRRTAQFHAGELERKHEQDPMDIFYQNQIKERNQELNTFQDTGTVSSLTKKGNAGQFENTNFENKISSTETAENEINELRKGGYRERFEDATKIAENKFKVTNKEVPNPNKDNTLKNSRITEYSDETSIAPSYTKAEVHTLNKPTAETLSHTIHEESPKDNVDLQNNVGDVYKSQFGGNADLGNYQSSTSGYTTPEPVTPKINPGSKASVFPEPRYQANEYEVPPMSEFKEETIRPNEATTETKAQVQTVEPPERHTVQHIDAPPTHTVQIKDADQNIPYTVIKDRGKETYTINRNPTAFPTETTEPPASLVTTNDNIQSAKKKNNQKPNYASSQTPPKREDKKDLLQQPKKRYKQPNLNLNLHNKPKTSSSSTFPHDLKNRNNVQIKEENPNIPYTVENLDEGLHPAEVPNPNKDNTLKNSRITEYSDETSIAPSYTKAEVHNLNKPTAETLSHTINEESPKDNVDLQNNVGDIYKSQFGGNADLGNYQSSTSGYATPEPVTPKINPGSKASVFPEPRYQANEYEVPPMSEFKEETIRPNEATTETKAQVQTVEPPERHTVQHIDAPPTHTVQIKDADQNIPYTVIKDRGKETYTINRNPTAFPTETTEPPASLVTTNDNIQSAKKKNNQKPNYASSQTPPKREDKKDLLQQPKKRGNKFDALPKNPKKQPTSTFKHNRKPENDSPASNEIQQEYSSQDNIVFPEPRYQAKEYEVPPMSEFKEENIGFGETNTGINTTAEIKTVEVPDERHTVKLQDVEKPYTDTVKQIDEAPNTDKTVAIYHGPKEKNPDPNQTIYFNTTLPKLTQERPKERSTLSVEEIKYFNELIQKENKRQKSLQVVPYKNKETAIPSLETPESITQEQNKQMTESVPVKSMGTSSTQTEYRSIETQTDWIPSLTPTTQDKTTGGDTEEFNKSVRIETQTDWIPSLTPTTQGKTTGGGKKGGYTTNESEDKSSAQTNTLDNTSEAEKPQTDDGNTKKPSVVIKSIQEDNTTNIIFDDVGDDDDERKKPTKTTANDEPKVGYTTSAEQPYVQVSTVDNNPVKTTTIVDNKEPATVTTTTQGGDSADPLNKVQINENREPRYGYQSEEYGTQDLTYESSSGSKTTSKGVQVDRDNNNLSSGLENENITTNKSKQRTTSSGRYGLPSGENKLDFEPMGTSKPFTNQTVKPQTPESNQPENYYNSSLREQTGKKRKLGSNDNYQESQTIREEPTKYQKPFKRPNHTIPEFDPTKEDTLYNIYRLKSSKTYPPEPDNSTYKSDFTSIISGRGGDKRSKSKKIPDKDFWSVIDREAMHAGKRVVKRDSSGSKIIGEEEKKVIRELAELTKYQNTSKEAFETMEKFAEQYGQHKVAEILTNMTPSQRQEAIRDASAYTDRGNNIESSAKYKENFKVLTGRTYDPEKESNIQMKRRELKNALTNYYEAERPNAHHYRHSRNNDRRRSGNDDHTHE